MPLEVALVLLAAAIPVSSFIVKLALNGEYLSQREFDQFRKELRADIAAIKHRLNIL